MSTLAEVLANFKRRIFEDLNVSMPGKVVEYDTTTRRATIQPLLLRRYAGRKDPVTLPLIHDVPIQQPRTATAQVRLPVAAGDIVTLLFTDRGLDKFLSGNGSARDPERTRAHALEDCVALLGGPWPDRSEPVTDSGPTNLSIKYNDSEITITPEGIVTVNGTSDFAALASKVDAEFVKVAAALTAVSNGGGAVTGANPYATPLPVGSVKVKLS